MPVQTETATYVTTSLPQTNLGVAMNDSPASFMPVELWIKIALTLRDGYPCEHGQSPFDEANCNTVDCPMINTRAVLPLSRVCRILGFIVQPIFYGYINMDFGASGIESDKLAGLIFTLSTRPDLRLSVHRLYLSRFGPGKLSPSTLRFFHVW